MRDLVLRVMPVLRLTRVSKVFAAVANVWFVVLWARAEPAERMAGGGHVVFDQPLWLLLLGGAGFGAGLYAYGAVLNDMLDIHRDRALRPDRPLAAGRVSVEAAVVGVAVTLIAGVLGSTVFGTGVVLLTLLLALAILVFNLVGKFIPAIGLVLLAAIYAGHMLVPYTGLRFTWPIVVVTTHALLVAGLTHTLRRKSPPITRRAALFVFIGWLLVTAGLLTLGWARSGGAGERTWWPEWVAWETALGPGVLAVWFAGLALRRIRTYGPGARAGEKIERYGAVWLPLYASAWLFGEAAFGDVPWSAGFIMLGLALAAILGTTVLREIYGLAEQPIGFRR